MVRRSDRSGFTLVEALIATVLGTLVIALVVSVVVAQGGYFRDLHTRSDLQETVRVAAEILRGELQGVTHRGIVTAAEQELSIRMPLAMGSVCGGSGSTRDVFLPLPGEGLDPDRVAGHGFRRLGTPDQWQYTAGGSKGPTKAPGSPEECWSAGLDTVGASGSIWEMSQLGDVPGGPPGAGDLIALIARVTYEIEESDLIPGSWALFRTEANAGTRVEVVSGLGSASGFEYRLANQTTFVPSVTGSGLDSIEEVWVTLEAEAPDPGAGGGSPYTWAFRVPLRNASVP